MTGGEAQEAAAEPVLKSSTEGRVRRLVLNRPDALNAFNDPLYRAVAAALDDAAADPAVAAVVLTGAGRAFSAGQDLAELGDARSHAQRVADGFGPFMAALEGFPKPLIAAVNGLGVGIGLTMLPHCDIVLMAAEARLRAPFVPLGVTAEAGSSLLLPAILGWGEAAHLLFTGAWLDAAAAKEAGLAWKVVPGAELAAETMALAGQIAAQPVPALVATKAVMRAARADALRAARDREDAAFAGLVGGPANREAIAAFREKRPPDFSGIV